MTTFRGTRQMPVIATESADEIGAVEHYAVRDGRIRSIHVRGGKRHALLLDWADVSFGNDAVMVEREDDLHEARDEFEHRAAAGELVMLDKRVLRDDGDELGTVSDVEFDPEEGTIIAVHVGDRTIAGRELRGVGDYAVVVTDGS